MLLLTDYPFIVTLPSTLIALRTFCDTVILSPPSRRLTAAYRDGSATTHYIATTHHIAATATTWHTIKPK